MTAVVSQAVQYVLRKGVQEPADGQWELQTIENLMTTIGGQRMTEELTDPAHNLSRALAKNMAGGDTAFLHHS
eukprot:16448323-Heterocapsa_arctica.AAC.1